MEELRLQPFSYYELLEGMVRRVKMIAHVLIFSLAAVLLGACVTPSITPYESLDASTLKTTVQGQITLMGSIVPEVLISKIYRDTKLCGEEVMGEELNVADGSQGIEGVIVSLEGITKGKPKPKEEVIIIENRGCRFIPYIAATVVGSILQVQNTDPILHTTHARFETRQGWTLWNVVQEAGAPGITKRLSTTGLVDVRCDLHPNMRSYVHVFNHPYYAVTDADGYFEFKNVPAGTYQVRIWHARIGIRSKPVTVPDEGIVVADLGVQLRRQ